MLKTSEMKVVDLTREQKVQLIKKLAAGEAHVINGEIIELSPVIVYKGVRGDDWENAEKYWINDKELTPEELDNVMEFYPKDYTFIFMPAKNEEIEE